MKRAGTIVTCGFHAFTVHLKSENRWVNLVVFEDMDKQAFCHVFQLDKAASCAMMQLLLAGVNQIDSIEKPRGNA